MKSCLLEGIVFGNTHIIQLKGKFNHIFMNLLLLSTNHHRTHFCIKLVLQHFHVRERDKAQKTSNFIIIQCPNQFFKISANKKRVKVFITFNDRIGINVRNFRIFV